MKATVETPKLVSFAKEVYSRNGRLIPYTSCNKSSKCGKNKCRICPLLSEDNSLLRNPMNKRLIECYRPKDSSCITSNLVYNLQCPLCCATYIGETKRKLKQRISEHLRDINDGVKNTALVNHYHSAHGKIVYPIVKIVYLLERENTKERRSIENEYIDAMNCVWPMRRPIFTIVILNLRAMAIPYKLL